MIKSIFFFLNNIPTSCLHHPEEILIYSDSLRTSKVLGAASLNFDLRRFILVINCRYLGWLTESFKHLFSFSKASLEFPCWSSWNQGLAEKSITPDPKNVSVIWSVSVPYVEKQPHHMMFLRFIPPQNTMCRMSLIFSFIRHNNVLMCLIRLTKCFATNFRCASMFYFFNRGVFAVIMH